MLISVKVTLHIQKKVSGLFIVLHINVYVEAKTKKLNIANPFLIISIIFDKGMNIKRLFM